MRGHAVFGKHSKMEIALGIGAADTTRAKQCADSIQPEKNAHRRVRIFQDISSSSHRFALSNSRLPIRRQIKQRYHSILSSEITYY